MLYEDKIYQHEVMRDVAFYVTNVSLEQDGVEISGYWMNVFYNEIGEKDPFVIGDKIQTIFIHSKKLGKWHEYIPEERKGALQDKVDFTQKNS